MIKIGLNTKEDRRMQESERIRKILGISRAEFSRRYGIPTRTLEEWDAGRRTPPEYVVSLLERCVREDKLKELVEEKNRILREIEETQK